MRGIENYGGLSTPDLKDRLGNLVSRSDELKNWYEQSEGWYGKKTRQKHLTSRVNIEAKIASASSELHRRGYDVDITRKMVSDSWGVRKYKSDIEITPLKKEQPKVQMPRYVRALPPHIPVRKAVARLIKQRVVARGLQEKILTPKQIETLRKSGSVDITINGIKKRVTKANVPLRKRSVFWYTSGKKIALKVMR